MIDILIIGAGPSGLCTAKTLLQQDAAAKVVLIDGRATAGGVWAREKLYPTLRTNNLFTSLDFTDFPMDAARFGVGPGQHITGDQMHAYLTAYAEHFGIADKIRFNTKAVNVRRRDGNGAAAGGGGWDVELEGGEVLQCRKLVVATGVLNEPSLPRIDGIESFGAPFLHSCDLGPQAHTLTEDPQISTVAVLGGGKSAYDAVYLAATSGHRVEWIIRRSGRGPSWVFPTHTMLGPVRAWREQLVLRRVLSFMSPCVFPDLSGLGWLRRFLHTSAVGRFVASKFWAAIHADTVRDCRFRADPRFAVLEPEHSPFWYGTSSGTLNYDIDFLDLVSSGRVRIHRADISHVSHRTIHLVAEDSNTAAGAGYGTVKPAEVPTTELSVDALVAATGYASKPSISFSPATLLGDLGVPATTLDTEQTAFWAKLDAKADGTIRQQFPQLIPGPRRSAVQHSTTPWRLYRGIAPPNLAAAGDRSLVFVGIFSNIANTMRLEVQSLWAAAYLSGKIAHLDDDDDDDSQEEKKGRIYAATALAQRWAMHRAPFGHGAAYPDLVFDQLPYLDLLLHDLGLETRRKPTALRELFEAYSQADYRGIVDEWLAKQA
ncbi:cofactor FMO1 FAD enzyme [Lasiosphaeria ovina]|uniref:Cofactor FMO1 FAD enzyme n=1 Tax=Lasiosphaeria ovina TaxID=92902 RepID=A0AAE0K815_9PEZI|nr:cofactor FMO1 FAD enzyme [Lasiosphaeria ovina]